jgi:hypothetical protein
VIASVATSEAIVDRRKSPFPSLSPDQAHAALRWLHATGKVRTADIVGALKKREQLVAEIKARLEVLGGEGLRYLGPASFRRRAGASRRRRKPSAKAQAVWRLQGRYMAAVRRLPKATRAKMKAIREKKGVLAAIAAANRMART